MTARMCCIVSDLLNFLLLTSLRLLFSTSRSSSGYTSTQHRISVPPSPPDLPPPPSPDSPNPPKLEAVEAPNTEVDDVDDAKLEDPGKVCDEEPKLKPEGVDVVEEPTKRLEVEAGGEDEQTLHIGWRILK